MKVSIIVLSYNHELYIGETLQSIIDQKTDFQFEILIGDDCSKDNSRMIINQYFECFPNIIKRIFPNKNLGPNSNYLNCFTNTKGKYIALCEGDDYWIDENKLQKQVNFLENNPKYGGVSTNNRWFFEKENIFQDSLLKEGEITFEDLSKSNQINSQTALYRKELVNNIEWINSLKIGDWAVSLQVTSNKPYYRLPDITTVYRVHQGGVYSLLKEDLKIRNRVEVLIAVLKHVDLTLKRKELLRASIRRLLKISISYNSKDLKTTRKEYFESGGTIFNRTILKSYFK